MQASRDDGPELSVLENRVYFTISETWYPGIPKTCFSRHVICHGSVRIEARDVRVSSEGWRKGSKEKERSAFDKRGRTCVGSFARANV
jgi:hypothetical protein